MRIKKCDLYVHLTRNLSDPSSEPNDRIEAFATMTIHGIPVLSSPKIGFRLDTHRLFDELKESEQVFQKTRVEIASLQSEAFALVVTSMPPELNKMVKDFLLEPVEGDAEWRRQGKVSRAMELYRQRDLPR